MSESKPNHLINEKSPYLLQHAYNPVEWYPWGEEAFEKAKKENKPILLSIGYSTCHWCHVMENESFSNSEIAAVMNEHLVSIKVDREERPDVDKIYMASVQVMTGQGGWPLNVFLTPELKPFYGGTYFPPETRWGRTGWPDLVKKVGLAWKDPVEQKKIIESSENLTSHVGKYIAGRPGTGKLTPSILEKGFKAFSAEYDSVLGGFSGAPKFPMPVNHHFLLSYYDFAKGSEKDKSQEALEMSLETLKAMAQGGIYDQIGGGFARYSTDEKWHVPHFEKMLYDNSQLASVYLDAYAISGDDFFKRVAQETLDYILRDMTSPQGGFYSAEDADSLPPELAGKVEDKDHTHRKEGSFYLWNRKEILKILGKENGEFYTFLYGIKEQGNVETDPHGEFSDKNIPYLASSIQDTAAEFKTSENKVAAAILKGRTQLLEARSKRPRPHLDDKVIASWNGLMISAFVRGWQVLGEPKYLEAAEKAAQFIKNEMFDSNTGLLSRRWRDGEKKITGHADDYAFYAQACLDLYESNFDVKWYRLALALMERLQDHFYDGEQPGLFMTDKTVSNHLLFRARDDSDNVEPSASSVAVSNAIRIQRISGKVSWGEWAEKILENYADDMERNPRAYPQLMSSLAMYLSKPFQILLVGQPSGPEFKSFLEAIYHRYLPNKSLIVIPDRWRAPQELPWVYEMLKAETKDRGPVTAYVCVNYACSLPTGELKTFHEQLSVLLN